VTAITIMIPRVKKTDLIKVAYSLLSLLMNKEIQGTITIKGKIHMHQQTETVEGITKFA
jgi:hypothetical protein